MKKILSLLLALAMCISLVACGNNDNQVEPTSNDTNISEKSEKDKYIGVWEYVGEISSDSDRYPHQMKVYKGGSGERVIVDKNNSEPIILPFSWEINDDVFNMIVSDFGETNKMGFVIEDGILTSVNGEYKFEKVEK